MRQLRLLDPNASFIFCLMLAKNEMRSFMAASLLTEGNVLAKIRTCLGRTPMIRLRVLSNPENSIPTIQSSYVRSPDLRNKLLELIQVPNTMVKNVNIASTTHA